MTLGIPGGEAGAEEAQRQQVVGAEDAALQAVVVVEAVVEAVAEVVVEVAVVAVVAKLVVTQTINTTLILLVPRTTQRKRPGQPSAEWSTSSCMARLRGPHPLHPSLSPSFPPIPLSQHLLLLPCPTPTAHIPAVR